MEQPSRFQKLVAEAKKNITEISPAEARQQVDGGEAVLIDVREDERLASKVMRKARSI